MTGTPWTWPGSTVTRVIDGDSLVARLTRDIGFNGAVTFLQRLRLARIDTPTAGTDAGKAATARSAELTANMTVHIVTVKPYKYGDEWMAEVTLADGRNLSDVLIAEGHAVLWDGRGSRPGG